MLPPLGNILCHIIAFNFLTTKSIDWFLYERGIGRWLVDLVEVITIFGNLNANLQKSKKPQTHHNCFFVNYGKLVN